MKLRLKKVMEEHPSTEEIVLLIRKLVYDIPDYGAFAEVISDNEDPTPAAQLTSAFFEYLGGEKSCDASMYPYLLALAFAMENGLLDDIDIGKVVEELKRGEMPTELDDRLMIEPYVHYRDIYRLLCDERSKEKRWNIMMMFLYAVLLILVASAILATLL